MNVIDAVCLTEKQQIPIVPGIYCIQDEHSNHYTIDAVSFLTACSRHDIAEKTITQSLVKVAIPYFILEFLYLQTSVCFDHKHNIK